MANYKYDNPDDAYKQAQRCIKEAKGGFLRGAATKLDLSGMGLTIVPPEVWQLKRLTMLDLSGNQLTAVPPEIGQLTELISLLLQDNQLTAVPSQIWRLTKLTGIRLDGNQLTTMPPGINQLTELTSLDLSDNQLKAIPPGIGQLMGLRVLRLNDNQLTTVPSEIGQLTELIFLDLNNNQLKAIPSEVGQWTELKWLSFGSNQLTAVPPEIGQLTRLTALYLGGNQLTDIPFEIGHLKALKELSFSENQLTTISPEIGQLTELIELYLRKNKLTSVPPEITQLTNLGRLWLEDNPDLLIPPEIVAQKNNAQAILNYLRQRQEESARPLNEAKLIFVGQGGVGKTSLVKQLLGQGFDEVENQTEGINIETWSLAVNRQQQGVVPVALHIWDFGGQEIMHATHQFFLTKRSLYLLVLDARQGEDEGRVEYWLALINSFAPDAPVLIIINKSDQHHLDINRRGLQEKYPAIKGFLRTSARDDEGIDELKTEIAALLAEMPHVDSLFPSSWMRVKTDLVAMQAKRHFLPYEEYVDICRQHGIAEESSQTTLVRFLHDLGIVLNFTDDDRVRDTSVLNPNWVTEGIYALLNSPKLQKEHGLLARNQMRELLSRDDYPSQQRRFLLDMMLKFDLAFDLPDRQTLLIPDLISKEQPEFEWDEAHALQFAYQYRVLPRSILHRFMVRQHQRVDPEIRWRTGVMLHHDGFTALVKADIKAATIRISIIGDGDRRQFLYSLRLEFAGIHDTIQGTKPREVVPIPGHPDAQPIDYAYLEQLEKMKMATVPHHAQNGEVIMLDVQELLNGVSTSEMRQAGLPTRREVLSALKAGFDKGEFHELLFELGIGKNDIGGESTADQMRECVEFAERNNKYQDLVTAIASKRPYLFDESRRPMA